MAYQPDKEQMDELYESILMLKDKDECRRFFNDVCTVREIESIAQRLKVAKLLRIRKTYNEIEQETGASTETISRVNRTLQYGESGYELVLDHLIQKNLREEKKNK